MSSTLDLRWQLPLAVSVFAIGLTIWASAAYMIPMSINGQDRIDELSSISPSSLYGPGSGGLNDLSSDLDALASDISGAATAFRWVGHLSKGLSWVPLIERELTSWEFAATRAKADVETARALVAGTEAMNVASSAVGTAFTGDSFEVTEAAVLAAIGEFTRARGDLDRTWPTADSVGVALNLLGVRSALGSMGEVEDRMAAAARVGLATTELLDVALGIAEQARPIIGPILDDTGLGLPDFGALSLVLGTIEADASEAGLLIERITGMLDEIGELETLQSDLAVLSVLLSSIGGLTEAAGVGIEVLRPVIELASSNAEGLLGGPGLATALDLVAQDLRRLDTAIKLADDAADDLERLDREGSSELLTGAVSDLAVAARSFHEGLGLVSGLSRVSDSLFGPDGERSYLVLGLSADELRATGGFVSAVWVASLSLGALEQVEYFDVVRVDDFDRIDLYPVGPPGLEEHMNGWVWLMRDVSWDPNFPTSAVAAQDIFNLGQRRSVDGVIAVNQWGMLELVRALGSVASPDGGGGAHNPTELPEPDGAWHG